MNVRHVSLLSPSGEGSGVRLTLFIALATLSIEASAQLPSVISGKSTRIENFDSKFVPPRTVDVWVPNYYNPKKKYAVLYMHDGQMLFDSTTTWNKQAWDADDVVGKLIKDKKIRDVIVVGVWSISTLRHSEYFPQKPFESLTQAERDTVVKSARRGLLFPGPINSDNYLKFLVNELKPYIDKTFSTKKDRANTFIAGSSMGGLISMYAVCEYPNVFGGAACISTHWPGIFAMENNPIPGAFLKYLKATLPNPRNHRIYFDYGTATLDALYPPLQKQVDEVMKSKGWTSKNWLTREFIGEDHSEKSWKKRLDIPVVFLLGR